VVELVAAGLGVTLLVADGPVHPGVRYINIGEMAGSRRIYACTRPGRAGWRNNAALITAAAHALATPERAVGRPARDQRSASGRGGVACRGPHASAH
jgi:hypothetical protein